MFPIIYLSPLDISNYIFFLIISQLSGSLNSWPMYFIILLTIKLPLPYIPVLQSTKYYALSHYKANSFFFFFLLSVYRTKSKSEFANTVFVN